LTEGKPSRQPINQLSSAVKALMPAPYRLASLPITKAHNCFASFNQLIKFSVLGRGWGAAPGQKFFLFVPLSVSTLSLFSCLLSREKKANQNNVVSANKHKRAEKGEIKEEKHICL